MNRSVQDIGGGLLLVSQFTLAADTSRRQPPQLHQCRRARRGPAALRLLRGPGARGPSRGADRRVRRRHAGASGERWAGDDSAARFDESPARTSCFNRGSQTPATPAAVDLQRFHLQRLAFAGFVVVALRMQRAVHQQMRVVRLPGVLRCSRASRSTTGAHSTRSAITTGSLRVVEGQHVGRVVLAAILRLSSRPSSSPTMRTVISPGASSAWPIQRATLAREQRGAVRARRPRSARTAATGQVQQCRRSLGIASCAPRRRRRRCAPPADAAPRRRW